MSDWLISVPVWGEPYVATFARCAAPALMRAVHDLGEPVKFVVHTDCPDAVRAALPAQDVECRPVPEKPTYVTLQESHADGIAAAPDGGRVVLLNADLVVSGNFLRACAAHLSSGAQAVVLLGIRTVAGPEAPPAGGAPRDLLAWAWAHRHQIIRDLEWPHGGSMLPTNLFFAAGESVIARGFHLHPAAIIKRPGMSFHSTIDGDLLDCFPRGALHVVVDPDDCAMAEVSAPERRFPVRGAHQTCAAVAAAMRTRASGTHRWLFAEHRILVRGRFDEVDADIAVAAEVMRHLSGPGGALPRHGGRRVPRGLVPAGPRGTRR